MTVYHYILLFVLLFTIIELNLGSNSKGLKVISNSLFFITFVFLIFFVGLRYDTGFDYRNFEKLFYILRSENAPTIIEPAFALLCNIVGSFRTLLLVMSVLTFVPLYLAVKRYSPYRFFSLLLYLPILYQMAMGQMRQGVAISFLLLAFLFLANKEKRKFVFVVIIASLFHASALLAFAALFVPNKIKSNKLYFIILGVAAVLNFTIRPLAVSLIYLFPAGFIQDSLLHYVRTEVPILGINFAAILRIITVLLGIFLRKKYENDTVLCTFFNIFFIGAIFYIALGIIPQLGVRGSLNLTIVEILIIPAFFYLAKKWIKLAIFIIYTFISINRQSVYFMDSSSRWFEDYVPYKHERLL